MALRTVVELRARNEQLGSIWQTGDGMRAQRTAPDASAVQPTWWK
ncbi:hypothetical protein ACWD1Y_45915 [Streptomyces sp. NPDC002814]